jgi:hypothetical protein
MKINDKLQKRRWGLWFSIFAIIISFGALIISGLSFYYQNLRQVNNAKATILKLSPDNSSESGFLSNIVFINNGNKPASIYEMWVTIKYANIENSCHLAPWIEEVPFTINPSEVITHQISFGHGASLNYLDNLRYSQTLGKEKGIKIGLRFNLIDSSGRHYEIDSPVLILNEFDKNGKPTSWNYPFGMPEIVTLLQ